MDKKVPDAALILAGGLGTRLRPITNIIPKSLVDIGGKPTIAHTIEEIGRNGIKNIYISVGCKAEKIEEYLKNYATPADIIIIREKRLLGTGGAIALAIKRMRRGDIFVTNGDDLFRLDMQDMYAFHKKHGSEVTIGIRKAKSNAELSSSGVVKLRNSKVLGFVEKPKPKDAPSRYISMGKYIFSTSMARYFPKKRKFSFEHEFLEKVTEKVKVYSYRVKGPWYTTDTPERLGIARSKWRAPGEDFGRV